MRHCPAGENFGPTLVSPGKNSDAPRAKLLSSMVDRDFRRAAMVVLLCWASVFRPGFAWAENAVAFWGNYYLERSTRVISPMVTLDVDLPRDTEIELTYLVDNITSASGNFQSEESTEPFQEFRQEVRLNASTEFLGFLRPGITARYSFEPDYTSFTYGLSLSARLFEDNTTLTISGQRQNDAIMARGNNFEDTLDTWRTALSISQVVLPELIAGASFEAQFLDGYTENPYRSEEHPRTRERFAIGGWLAYRFRSTRTTVRPSYRYYWDDWSIEAHTFDLQVYQELTPDLEIVPQVRLHTQTGVNFRRQILEQGRTFRTSDPKLMALGTTGLGLRLVWTLGFLKGTALDPFKKVAIHPRYMFFAQRRQLELNPVRIVDPDPSQETQFGDAHIAQLGISWPF